MNKRQHAVQLRKKGYSYTMIQEEIPVSKATLSQWLSALEYSPSKEALRRAKMGPIISGEKRRLQKQENINKIHDAAKLEIGHLSERDILMVGIGLYIGEGSKSLESVRMINSDPRIISFSIKWLTQIANVSPKDLAIELHAYPDTDIPASIEYWSKICGVTKTSFTKTQIDRRVGKKPALHRKLPHGTVQVRVKSNGDSSKGVALYRRIEGLSNAVLDQV